MAESSRRNTARSASNVEGSWPATATEGGAAAAAAALEARLVAESRVSELGARLEEQRVSLAASSERNGVLESRVRELERAVVIAREQASAVASAEGGTRRGSVLEENICAVVERFAKWTFEVERVGASESHAMDIRLTERRPVAAGARPLVLLFECKHKARVRHEDVAKFLRDLDAARPDAAVFYSTSPLPATVRVPLDGDGRVVVAEETGDRPDCVLGALAEAWVRARERAAALARARAQAQCVADAGSGAGRWPPDTRPWVEAQQRAILGASAALDDVNRRVVAARRELRDALSDLRARQERFRTTHGLARGAALGLDAFAVALLKVPAPPTGADGGAHLPRPPG